LAKELSVQHVLLDEKAGRGLAEREGLQPIGVLGIVIFARRAGHIPSARNLLDRLEAEAGIYLAGRLKESALRRIGE